MANIILPPGWQAKERDVTSQAVYQNRRRFLKQMGLGTIGLATASPFGCSGQQATAGVAVPDGPLDTIPELAPKAGYPAAPNDAFAVPERAVTDRIAASSYNNFYEFKHQGDLKDLWGLTGPYEPFPGTLEIDGMVEKPFRIDISELITSMELEERLYRFRCVEAWSMTIPWTGFPLSKLIERCKPLSKATHVRFVSINRPDQMPGIRSGSWYPWPYYEGLRMDEAMNDLAFVATGMYGEPLPKQNGSPIRLALPWKYGYKGPKAVIRIEFIDEQPATFWSDLQPLEYPFLSNVNPNVPHPRWSQASEKFILDDPMAATRLETKLFNGYAEWVGSLYPGERRS